MYVCILFDDVNVEANAPGIDASNVCFVSMFVFLYVCEYVCEFLANECMYVSCSVMVLFQRMSPVLMQVMQVM